MAETSNTGNQNERKGEIGRVNNEKDPGQGREIPQSEREVGTTNPDPNLKAPPRKQEIGRTNNQNPREQKPEEEEIGVVHNEKGEKGRSH
jgi:hypothetical protein